MSASLETDVLRPRGFTSEAIADSIELTMVVHATRAMSFDRIYTRLREVSSVFPQDVEMAVNTMKRRQAVCAAAYPFDVSAVGIRMQNELGAYAAMLLMSHDEAPCRATHRQLSRAAELLETLTVAAVPGLFGPEAKAVRFGWPSEHGRPHAFPDAVRWLSELTGIPVGSAYRPPRRQDGGVDVVGWRPFGDGQPGLPLILIQCTLEQEFIHKSSDIDLRLWAGWLSFDVDPLTALAIPYTVAKDEDWREMAARTVVLDRLRLALLLRDSGAHVPAGDEWMTHELAVWRERNPA